MAASLSATDRLALGRASRAGCMRYAEAVCERAATAKEWLPRHNRYRHDPTTKLKREVRAGGVRKAADLGRYIVASAFVHCWDGWTYLGRALHAHAGGRADIARHLGYYAELRGAMALLAAEGIGVFDKHHFVIDGNGKISALSERSTHEAAWLYLQEWARYAGAELVGKVVRPEGAKLATWVSCMPGGPSWQPLGTDWLLRLGLDLRRLVEDRAARNEASYRPKLLPQTTTPATDAVQTVVEFVRDLEPEAAGGFAVLDLHLLRRTLELAFRSVTGRTRGQARRRYQRAIQVATGAVVSDGARRALLSDFLNRNSLNADAPIIQMAERIDQPQAAQHHLQVIARGAILLRLATGAASEMLRAAGMSLDSTEWWWGAVGVQQALWRSVPATADLSDVWLDFQDSLEDLDAWLAAADDASTYRDVSETCAVPLSRVTALEALTVLGADR